MLLVCSCNRTEPEPLQELDQISSKTYVAFAGGGWRAHTGHTGWILSLLDSGKRDLKSAFANVDVVASNSGGSWFSTMLSYSEEFRKQVEDSSAILNWSTSGWLGTQEALFNKAQAGDCYLATGDKFLACVAAYYLGLDGATYWDSIIQEIVFHNYSLGTTKLSDKRQPWAKDKTILLAGSMLTSQVVLNQISDDLSYYQACLQPSEPNLMAYEGAECLNGGSSIVSPVVFSSLPSSSKQNPPPFFSAINSDHNQFNIGYTTNAYQSSHPPAKMKSVSNPIVSDQVEIMHAAAASSAAAGFAASLPVLGYWDLAYASSDAALSFSLEDGVLKHQLTKGLSFEELTKKNIVRIADGGPVDNSGVTQILSYLQTNNRTDSFNIVAFDNVSELYIGSDYKYRIGADLANLFGHQCPDDQFCSGDNCTGTCVTTADLMVFDSASLHQTPVKWSLQTSSNQYDQQIIYTKYKVTTVDNSAYGIKAGRSGTLHAFTCMWQNAGTSPQNETTDGDFKAYSDMLNFIYSGLRATPNGQDYLEEAFGL